jgi:hypothetical protein
MRNKLTAGLAALLVLGTSGMASANVILQPMSHVSPLAKKSLSVGGIVTAAGQIVSGSGFTISHDGTGKYTIDIPSGFNKGCPVIMVTPAGANGDVPIANDFNYETCGSGPVKIQILIYGRSSGGLMDNSFNFLVINP